MILKCCIRCRLTISPPMAPLRYSRIANRRRGSAIWCGAFGDWFAHDNSNLQHVLLFVEQNAFNGKALHAAMKQLLRHRGDESILMLSARTLANPHSAFNISSSIGVSHGFRNKAVYPEPPEISVGGGRKPSGGAVFQSAPERLVTYDFISVVHVTPNTGTERLGRPSAFAWATEAARPLQ